MDTQQLTTRTERVDDIPLLLAQMRKIRLAELIDQHFQAHGNWQGLSLSPLSAVQERILELLDFPVTIYLALTG